MNHWLGRIMGSTTSRYLNNFERFIRGVRENEKGRSQKLLRKHLLNVEKKLDSSFQCHLFRDSLGARTKHTFKRSLAYQSRCMREYHKNIPFMQTEKE